MICVVCKNPGLLYCGSQGTRHLGSCKSFGFGNSERGIDTIIDIAIEHKDKILFTKVNDLYYDELSSMIEGIVNK